MSECPIITPVGTRWDKEVVYFYIDDMLPERAQAWLLNEYYLLRNFVHANCALRLGITKVQADADVENVTFALIDGEGGTLGVTYIYASGEILAKTLIVCDSADLGPLAAPTKKHEFLHALGLEHNEISDSLMFAFANGAKDYDKYAAAALAERYPRQKPKGTRMARAIIPHPQALQALDFVRDFNLDVDQIIYRYTVEHIDTMCFEMGLRPIDGEKEEDKATRLLAAIGAEKPVVKVAARKAAKKADEPS